MSDKENKENKKVIVAMSGGVDSSTTAFLLKKKGYQVIGVFMKLGIKNQEKGESAARRVCQKLNINFYPINLGPEFKKEVIDYFLDSYSQGHTPNPCVKCNRFIKFGQLLKIARELSGDYLATGHYTISEKLKACPASQGEVGVKSKKNIYKLQRGKDEKKDQSYFLYTLTQEQLEHILFPLGEYTKVEVRKIAEKEKLPYLKSESQDICFLSGDHNDFIQDKIKMKPGPIKLITSPLTPLLDKERGDRSRLSGRGRGEVIGQHQGLPLYTIGQRRGVEIGGTGPYYVLGTDYKTNTLYVTKDRDDPRLYSDELIAKSVNWISGVEPKLPFNCQAVIRYGHKGVECKMRPLPTPPLIKRREISYNVKLKKPQRAVTPGQSVVFYKRDEVIGGGTIGIADL